MQDLPNKGPYTVQISILDSNSNGEKYLPSQQGPEELGPVCFQEKHDSLKPLVSWLWPGLLTPLSNVWFDGHVLIACKILQILSSVHASEVHNEE